MDSRKTSLDSLDVTSEEALLQSAPAVMHWMPNRGEGRIRRLLGLLLVLSLSLNVALLSLVSISWSAPGPAKDPWTLTYCETPALARRL